MTWVVIGAAAVLCAVVVLAALIIGGASLHDGTGEPLVWKNFDDRQN